MSRPEGFSHHEAEVNGLRYHYVREGAGPPLLLIHGWPGFWYEWRLNIKPLAAHFDVIALDMRGYGASDKPDLPPAEGYAPDMMAEDIRAFVQALGLSKVSIVSHDFGSLWSQLFVRAHPEMIDKLVLFNPAYPGMATRFFTPDRLNHIWYMFFHNQSPLAEELVGSSRKATEIYLRNRLAEWSYDKSLWTDEEIEVYVDTFSQPGALRAGFNCYRAMLANPAAGLTGDLRINAPTRIIWSENDPIFPSAWSDQLAAFFPNHSLRLVPECGHFIQREKPDLVNAEVIEFVSGRAPAK